MLISKPLRMRLLMLTKSKLHFFYTRIKDQHHYLGQDQIQTGATSPSRDRRSEANSIYEIRIRLHIREEPLSRHYERGKTQRRQIEGEEVLRPKITNPSPKSFLPNLTLMATQSQIPFQSKPFLCSNSVVYPFTYREEILFFIC